MVVTTLPQLVGAIAKAAGCAIPEADIVAPKLTAKVYEHVSTAAGQGPAITASWGAPKPPENGDVGIYEPIELIDDVLTVPEAFRETHPDARALRIRGESMNKLFQADSFVIFDPELEVRDGDIAVVYVNGDDATVKRVYFAGDTVVLHPESTMEEHLDRAINTKDPSSPPVTFAGRVFWATWGDNDVRF